ncbi:sensor histidine kinase [Nocardia niigatensis]|uniref:sensor histidine kinase n=1 Tax=Nocardia niigatensis TaxID=209249 RepID=UPI0002F89843|nr:nitrate- and nitrite sensing domain-containing protein [Nocardia niigatensis]
MTKRNSWLPSRERLAHLLPHGTFGVRDRVLIIVLIPSLTLLGIGVGAAGYLVVHGRHTRDWAQLASGTIGPAVQMVKSFQEERRLSILHLSGDASADSDLITARQASDAVLEAVRARGQAASEMRSDMAGDIHGFDKLYSQLPVLRARIDQRIIPGQTAIATFGSIIDVILTATVLSAQAAPSPDVVDGLFKSIDALRACESLSRASAFASTTDPMTTERFIEFVTAVGEQRSEVAFAVTTLRGPRLAQLQAILDSPDWHRIIDRQDAIIGRGPSPDGADNKSGSRATQVTTAEDADAQAAAAQTVPKLLALWNDQTLDAQAIAVKYADDVARESMLGGAAVLVTAIAGFVAAMAMANRLIGRMRRLRGQTLKLTDTHLPEMMRRLEAGEAVDPRTSEASRLELGTDEIGQVADAFNRAYAAAVGAAVAEAKIRSGVSAVFVDIAQRSQVIVHRQLEVLDAAEAEEQDPRQLELLFQLDHLTTRARRHAENLIILGGGRPGRNWSKPIPLIDIVRAAVGESVQYRRITVGRPPDIHVAGVVVADLIHVLAELMDNATAYSPPDSRVEVSGQVVGKGAVFEIVDQGLGIPEDELVRLNTLLSHSPGFDLDAIAGGGRLGLFVVATLAARLGVSVRLSESVFGGVRAVVLIPSSLLTTAADDAAMILPANGATAGAQGARGIRRGHDSRPEFDQATGDESTGRSNGSASDPHILG